MPVKIPEAPARKPRLAELDALRGVAALAVLLYHYTSIYPRLLAHRDFQGVPRFGVGYFGVELFFMISGFVIFFSAAHARSVYDFAVSRFSRLFPAYWGAVILTAMIEGLSAGHPGGAGLLKIAVNLTMLQSFLGVDNLDPSYWTLAYELSFYALIALALRVTAARRWRIEAALLLWLGCALILRGGGIHVPYRLAIAGLLDYGQFFVFGVAMFRIYEGSAGRLTYLTAASALLMSAFGADPHTPAAGFADYFPLTLICAALLAWTVLRKPGFLRTAPLQFLGRISYSLYLTHSTIGFFVIRHVTAHGGSDIFAVLAAIAAAIPAGYLLNILVEAPGQRALRRSFDRAAPWRLSRPGGGLYPSAQCRLVI